MNKYHVPVEIYSGVAYIYPDGSGKHKCKYWWTSKKFEHPQIKLFEVINNWPIKHWRQDVVEEIVDEK